MRRRRRSPNAAPFTGWWAVVLVHILFALFAPASNPQMVDSFRLARFDHPQEFFDSDDAREAILVLDFFAFWCGPCVETSRRIEEELRPAYVSPSDSVGTVEVRVLAVNVDQRAPAQTRRFMARAGLPSAFEDMGGELFGSLNPSGLPLVVVMGPADPGGRRAVRWHGTGLNEIDIGALRAVIEHERKRTGQLASPPPDAPFPVAQLRVNAPEHAPADRRAADAEADRRAAMTPIRSPSVSPPREDRAPARPQTPLEADSWSEPRAGSASPHRVASSARPLSWAAVAEMMQSDDVRLWQSDLHGRLEAGNWRLEPLLTFAHLEVDFEPAPRSLLEVPVAREESRWAGAASVRWETDRLSLGARGAAGRGFQDYRSLWLAEFYRQGFQFDPGYEAVTPRMWTAGGSLDWIFGSAQGRVVLDAAYQWDEVSPPYERIIPDSPREPIRTEVGLRELETVSFATAVEWIATERTRVEGRVSLAETTSRDLRVAGDLAVKRVIGQRWVTTLRLRGVEEGDLFHSRSVELGLERDWEDRWFCGVSARYYRDQGTVPDPTVVSAEAPPLETTRIGLRAAYLGDRFSISLGLFCYRSRYDALGANSFQFVNLYRDRDWRGLRLAVSSRY